MPDITRVAVKPNQGRASLTVGNEPAVQGDSALRLELDVFKAQTEITGIALDATGWVKNLTVFDRTTPKLHQR